MLQLTLALMSYFVLQAPSNIQTAAGDGRYHISCRVNGHRVIAGNDLATVPAHRSIRWELYNGGTTPVASGTISVRRTTLGGNRFYDRIRGRVPAHTSCVAAVIR